MRRITSWTHTVLAKAGIRERGATAVEYALMATLIAVVIVAAVIIIGENLSSIFADANTQI